MERLWLTTGFVLLSTWAAGLALAARLLHPAETEHPDRSPGAKGLSRVGPGPPSGPIAMAAGLAGTGLAVVSACGCLATGGGVPPYLMLGAVALVPFFLAAGRWYLALTRGQGGTVEERWWADAAVQSGILGVAAVGVGILLLGAPPWDSPAVLTAMAGAGSLTGALTYLLFCPGSLAGHTGGSGVAEPEPSGDARRERSSRIRALVGAGLLLTALSIAEVAWGWFCLGTFRPACGLLALWAAGGLLLPALSLPLIRLQVGRSTHRMRLAMFLSLAGILVGQWSALAVTLGYTALVPPPGW